MQAQLIRVGVIVGVAAVTALSVGYSTRELGGSPPTAEVESSIPVVPEQPAADVSAPQLIPPAGTDHGAPVPVAPPPPPVPPAPAMVPERPELTANAPTSPEHRSRFRLSGVRPAAPQTSPAPTLIETPAGSAVPAAASPSAPLSGQVPPDIPGIDPTDPSTWPADLRPPAAAGEPLEARTAHPAARAPASVAAANPVDANTAPSEKVLSYFQKTKTQVDTRGAFGFVLFTRRPVTAQEKRTQRDFCETILASLDFMTPAAVTTAVAEHHDILATYWPIDASRNSFDVSVAFAARDCDDLIAWYDYNLARALAARAGVAQLGGPLLMTWPSSGGDERDRDPLVVDFSKANHERATKALQYWFRQLRNRPSLWTNRIREGTIRAELADAVNDTAGVMLAVLSGKWDTLNTVTASATP
ncbi:MAG: hypothetical protein GC190_11225 [Alphaproteobacteria bacterium]|nr:hypothetical protein [Alphaproteobacteria bacterium]